MYYSISLILAGCQSNTSSRQCLAPEEPVTCKSRCAQAQQKCFNLSLTYIVKKLYGPCLQKKPVKVSATKYSD